MEAIANFFVSTGFYQFFQGDNWKSAIMLVIACVLLFLGIVKKFEPLLLVPIAFGMLVTNLPGADMFHEILFAGGHVHWDLFGGEPITAQFLSEMLTNGVAADVLQPYADAVMTSAQNLFSADVINDLMAQVAANGSDAVGTLANQLTALASAEQYAANYGVILSDVTVSVGLIDVLYLGIKLGIYPCLIFMGVGAMTDFGPLIANPKSLLLGAAAQLGIFLTYLGCRLLGFTGAEASSVGIIGGADGPTAIFVTAMLAPALLGPIAVSAYSYMALVPVIQPPIMKALTTKEERQIVMKPLREVSKREKIFFPIVVTVFVALLVPSAAPLIACLMLGNLAKECGVLDRLSKTMQNELMNIVTIFLGVSVGATATGTTYQLSVHQLLNTAENLLNQSVTASGIYFLTQFPVIIQKLCKTVYVSTLQFKAHQCCCFLDLLQRKQTVRFIAHIASHHITEKISRQTPLPCIDQDKSLIQFLLCLR